MNKKAKVADIIHFGNNLLRTRGTPVTVFHKGLHHKIDIISNTLKNHGGAALAASQISMLKQIIVIDYLGEYYELINPEIIEQSGEHTDTEGCLSLPNFWGNVSRFEKVIVKYQDRFGESHTVEKKGQMARCFQHEIDHLNGILYIDRMNDEYVFNDITKKKLSVKYLLDLTGQQPST